MVATHVVHQMDLDRPLLVYSIDTYLSADGWRDYVSSVAARFGWQHDIYDNRKGFEEYASWVEQNGHPYSRMGHTRAYARLKDRAIDAMKRDHKTHRYDRILFVSGIRKYESVERSTFESPFSRRGSGVFVNPLFYWRDEDLLAYRLEHDLPTNPFYETVGGSGDCQCNWGNFISLDTLRVHSPLLCQERVVPLHKMSLELHGWGWDEQPSEYLLLKRKGQQELFDDYDAAGEFSSPFLCQGCSRSKSVKQKQNEAAEQAYMQRLEW